MIIAICIYSMDQGCYKRIQYAQQQTHCGDFFPSNQLENLEKFSLLPFSQSTDGIFNSYEYENEHHYLCKPDKNKNIILAIVSKTPLQGIELKYLLININHVRLRPAVVKITLENIVKNPLGYTGKDLLIQAIHDELDETVLILHDALDKIVGRGVVLKELETTSFKLCYTSEKFKKESSKLNSCC